MHVHYNSFCTVGSMTALLVYSGYMLKSLYKRLNRNGLIRNLTWNGLRMSTGGISLSSIDPCQPDDEEPGQARETQLMYEWI